MAIIKSTYELIMKASKNYSSNRDKFISLRGMEAKLYQVIDTYSRRDMYGDVKSSLRRVRSSITIHLDFKNYYVELDNFASSVSYQEGEDQPEGNVVESFSPSLTGMVATSLKIATGDIVEVGLSYENDDDMSRSFWEVTSVEVRSEGMVLDKIVYLTPYARWKELEETVDKDETVI